MIDPITILLNTTRFVIPAPEPGSIGIYCNPKMKLSGRLI
jgi:hypothetical protein